MDLTNFWKELDRKGIKKYRAAAVKELDSIADEIQDLDPRIAFALDKISDELGGVKPKGTQPNNTQKPQSGPLQKIDPRTLTPEDMKNIEVQVQMKEAYIINNRRIMSFVIEAGLKDEFMKLFEKGKAAWGNAWSQIKDKAMQAAIKGLDSVQKIKEFLNKHPKLIYAVMAAIMLGYLAFPTQSFAEIIDIPTAQDMAKNDLAWTFLKQGGTNIVRVSISGELGDNLVLKSLADHGPATASQAMSDVYKNISEIIIQKAKLSGLSLEGDAFKELSKQSVDLIGKKIAPILAKFGL